MTPRQKLQLAYELAFHPVRRIQIWTAWRKGLIRDKAVLEELLDMACALHQRLPEAPHVTSRALRRLAGYQASSRMYRAPSLLRRFRGQLGRTDPIPEEVPSWMVRDIALPPFSRRRPPSTEGSESSLSLDPINF
jgi:hypothetical protein